MLAQQAQEGGPLPPESHSAAVCPEADVGRSTSSLKPGSEAVPAPVVGPSHSELKTTGAGEQDASTSEPDLDR